MRSQVQNSIYLFFSFFSQFFFFFFFIIVILDYLFIFVNNILIYLSRMESCLWWWSCYNNSLAQRPISHRIHSFLVNDVSVESTTAVAKLPVACPYRVRVDLGFYSGGRDLSKSLNWYQMLLAWSSDHKHRYVRRHAHGQARLPWPSNKTKSRCTVIAHTKEPSLTECIIYPHEDS